MPYSVFIREDSPEAERNSCRDPQPDIMHREGDREMRRERDRGIGRGRGKDHSKHTGCIMETIKSLLSELREEKSENL